MVGDRAHDIVGSRACGVAAIAVRWGYAATGELEAVHPLATFGTPDALRDALLAAPV
jgi:phosphoglycolate phosphatase